MNEHQQLLDRLLLDPGFRAAVEAALLGQMEHYLGKVRSYARKGESFDAAWAEGYLFALESVLGLLKSYVTHGKSRVNN